MTTIALAIISAAAFVFMYRVLRGPSLPDRAIALDGLLTAPVATRMLGRAAHGHL